MDAYKHLSNAYDELMHDVDYTAWGAYLNAFLQPRGVSGIFEAACGTGSISLVLHDLGYRITAADVSPGMLAAARRKARRFGRDVRFVQQDMRALKTGAPVDAVVCACDGANYVNEAGLNRFFAGAYDSLVPGGLLLFDISSRYKLMQVMDGQVFFDDAEEASCIWRCAFSQEDNALHIDVTLFLRSGEVFNRFDETHVQYAHSVQSVSSLLQAAGFEDIQVFEAFTQNPPSAYSQRIQFVCQKPKAAVAPHVNMV